MIEAYSIDFTYSGNRLSDTSTCFTSFKNCILFLEGLRYWFHFFVFCTFRIDLQWLETLKKPFPVPLYKLQDRNVFLSGQNGYDHANHVVNVGIWKPICQLDEAAKNLKEGRINYVERDSFPSIKIAGNKVCFDLSFKALFRFIIWLSEAWRYNESNIWRHCTIALNGTYLWFLGL